ncbi:sec-independent protein translocase protein TatA [Halorientalis persicus]|jgi:sec-independent protein translocase protein TatA|uniref:Sec-independent protein translocase protein TatA n=1 Tax=Halorientalis persicus TaxID=1367881 RepID=A0A1H8F112_9EURY|nr:LapA family protein [Halorientalis persicus]SEN24688.1 sec-independent protein translocase protein TatA [Halorientalis persicus]
MVALPVPSPEALPAGPLVVPGIPGGPELFVILLIAILLFGLPLVLVAGGYVYLRRDESIEELEQRIADLEAERAAGNDEPTGREDEQS